MIPFVRLALASTLWIVVDAPASGQGRELTNLRRQVASGELVPLSKVEQRLLPQLRAHEYLGAEFEPGPKIYRLKFLSRGNLVWIDVDARTGRTLRRIEP
jgi:hypothetical protein